MERIFLRARGPKAEHLFTVRGDFGDGYMVWLTVISAHDGFIRALQEIA